jgi:hypothetical protein
MGRQLITYNVSQLNNEVIIANQFLIAKPGFPQTYVALLRGIHRNHTLEGSRNACPP